MTPHGLLGETPGASGAFAPGDGDETPGQSPASQAPSGGFIGITMGFIGS